LVAREKCRTKLQEFREQRWNEEREMVARQKNHRINLSLSPRAYFADLHLATNRVSRLVANLESAHPQMTKRAVTGHLAGLERKTERAQNVHLEWVEEDDYEGFPDHLKTVKNLKA
jgi:hypothetical protein